MSTTVSVGASLAGRVVVESARRGAVRGADSVGDAALAVQTLEQAMRVHRGLLDRAAPRARDGEPVGAGLGGAWLLGRAAEVIAVCGDAAAELLADASHEMVRAQMLETEDLYDAGRPPARYFAVAERRAGSLLALAASLGALLGGVPRPALPALREYGTQLGVASEIGADIATIGGANGSAPEARQLSAGNYTLPVLYAFESDSALAASLGGPLEPDALPSVVDRIRAAGGIESAEAERRRRIGAARDAIEASCGDGLVAIADEVGAGR